jgi:hypothetical protein
MLNIGRRFTWKRKKKRNHALRLAPLKPQKTKTQMTELFQSQNGFRLLQQQMPSAPPHQEVLWLLHALPLLRSILMLNNIT